MARETPVLVSDRVGAFLEVVPMFLRGCWPLSQFYWQAGQIKAAEDRADQLAVDLDWFGGDL